MEPKTIYVIIESFRTLVEFNRTPITSSLNRNYDNTFSSTKRKAIEISNNINCNLYSINEILNTIECFYLYYHKGSIWSYISESNVRHCNRVYFQKYRLTKDDLLIKSLILKKGLQNVADFYKIDETGTCLASVLLENKYIGPEFYQKHLDCLLDLDNVSEKQRKITQVIKEKKKWQESLIGPH